MIKVRDLSGGFLDYWFLAALGKKVEYEAIDDVALLYTDKMHYSKFSILEDDSLIFNIINYYRIALFPIRYHEWTASSVFNGVITYSVEGSSIEEAVARLIVMMTFGEEILIEGVDYENFNFTMLSLCA